MSRHVRARTPARRLSLACTLSHAPHPRTGEKNPATRYTRPLSHGLVAMMTGERPESLGNNQTVI